VEALLWEMDQLEFESNKVDILSFTAEQELDAYETLDADIGLLGLPSSVFGGG
jgi:hypothetical protein